MCWTVLIFPSAGKTFSLNQLLSIQTNPPALLGLAIPNRQSNGLGFQLICVLSLIACKIFSSPWLKEDWGCYILLTESDNANSCSLAVFPASVI